MKGEFICLAKEKKFQLTILCSISNNMYYLSVFTIVLNFMNPCIRP